MDAKKEAQLEKRRLQYRKNVDVLREKSRVAVAKYREKFPEKVRRFRKARHLEKNYNLTIEEYEARHNTQGGVCAICGKKETEKAASGRVKWLAVDHDHRTGKVRGLLCHACNTGIGKLGDSVENLLSAIEYLRRG